MWAIENTGPAADDGLASLVRSPGETEARGKIVKAPVIDAVKRAQRTEAEGIGAVVQKIVHFFGDGEVIVAEAEVQDQAAADLEIVLNEAADLPGPNGERLGSKRERNRARRVGKEIGDTR